MMKRMHLSELTEFRKSDRKWHLPFLAGLCVGGPILVGYLVGDLASARLVSLAGFVVLYLHQQPVVRQMITLMSVSFGLMVSFTIGTVFSFDPLLSCFILGLFTFLVHLALFYLDMRRPPGNFFFLLIASVAISMPFDLPSMPHRIGLFALGTMFSCLASLTYCFLTLQTAQPQPNPTTSGSRYVNFTEAIIYGIFIGGGLLIGRLLELDNPYWIPTSCAAVMMGTNTRHVWQRSLQRIGGTLIGLAITWGILLVRPTELAIAVSIVALQIVVEFLVVRNYGIAVIFITILTIFLVESGTSLSVDPTKLIFTRFVDILIGSLLGAAGGWILYNERMQFLSRQSLRRTRHVIRKRMLKMGRTE